MYDTLHLQPDVSISIVIPTLNSERTIGICLKSLMNQSFQPSQIIVVDGLSSDSTIRITESFPKVECIINYSSHYPGSSRNLGVQSASSKYIFFFDSDCIADSRMLEYHAKAYLSRKRIQGVQGVIRSRGTGAFASMIQRQFTTGFWMGNIKADGTTRLLAPTGNNISLKREVLLANPFSEDLVSCDDIELMLKLRRQRCRVFFEPRAVAYHRHPTDPTERFRQWKWYGPGFYQICMKYPHTYIRRNSIFGTSRRFVRWPLSRLKEAVIKDHRKLCRDCDLGLCAINQRHIPYTTTYNETYLRQMTCLALAAGVLKSRAGGDFEWTRD